MSIVTPPEYTPVHQEEVGLDKSINEESKRKLIHNINWLLDLAPIGEIVYINVNLSGQPDPDRWQICDGSEITNPKSPLKTDPNPPNTQRFVPDLRNTYARFSPNTTSNNIVNSTSPSAVGSQFHALSHNHGGTGSAGGGGGLDDDPERLSGGSHAHGIVSNFSSAEFIDSPAYVFFNAYMKVA